MAVRTLSAGQSTEILMRGAIDVEAFALGAQSTPIRIELTGHAQYNRARDSLLKLRGGSGEIKISLHPVGSEEFGPGTQVRVVVIRGKMGTPAAQGVELPPIALDGRQSAVVGTLAFAGENLVVKAEGIRSEKVMTGVAAMVRAGVLSEKNRGTFSHTQIPAAPGVLKLIVDATASMSAQSTAAELEVATEVITGVVGALYPDKGIAVYAGKTHKNNDQPIYTNNSAELLTAVSEVVGQGAGHIGSGVVRGCDEQAPEVPTFCIRDEQPEPESNAGFSIVLGVRDQETFFEPRTRTLSLSPQLVALLKENNTEALRGVYADIVHACVVSE
ncbi:hypothetical protein [Corynebacterium sp. sy039]|uniref:hypothetical protein n=1 Tax=Corynebacterium sp. sy039 TaxID=2599641 RepID=UPI0011B6D721|nr:hypothetical protein [Corynebacterium sp. sy039]QDZ43193.1 hypothetical protein FQV43_08530 [Corynebacterium sp. sy039]